MTFPLEIIKTRVYNSVDVRRAPVSTPRTSPCYEIEMCTVASDGANVIDGTDYPLEVGRILVAHPGQRRYTKGHFECLYVHFICHDREFEEKFLRPLPQTLRLTDEAGASRLFRSIISAWAKQESGYELYAAGRLFELIYEIYTAGSFFRGIDEKYLRFSRNVMLATDYMRKNFGEPITLDDVAASAHISPSYFHLIFKSCIGVTPSKYLLDVRIREAQKLLLNTSMPLSQIADACGFDSQSYFTDVFRRMTGTTPGRFRRDNADIL